MQEATAAHHQIAVELAAVESKLADREVDLERRHRSEQARLDVHAEQAEETAGEIQAVINEREAANAAKAHVEAECEQLRMSCATETKVQEPCNVVPNSQQVG